KFYNDLSIRCTKSNLVIDVFACSLDQVGLAEMKSLVESTGGHIVLCESFSEETFQESFRKVFHRVPGESVEMIFGAELEVNVSRFNCPNLTKSKMTFL
ncbi:Protein transport protein Sec23A, partial [Bonamia ostreae]